MLIIGNRVFVLGMRFGGIKNSIVFESREQVLDLIRKIDKKEIIVVNNSILQSVPELKNFENLIVLPDNLQDFRKDDDLKKFVKDSLGFSLDI